VSISKSIASLNLSLAGIVAATCLGLPGAAVAQEGAAGAQFDEIVTTARKKSSAESVQEVPVAVTAFGAEQIDVLYGKNLTDEANCGNLTSISGLYTEGPMQKGRGYRSRGELPPLGELARARSTNTTGLVFSGRRPWTSS